MTSSLRHFIVCQISEKVLNISLNTDIQPFVLNDLQPRSHYNSLLFLRKEGFFAEDTVKIDERLEIMREKVKTFKGYTSASQASDEDSD